MSDAHGPRGPFWQGQLLHLGGCALLAAAVLAALPATEALVWALASAVAHQLWVLIGWRLELGRGWLSRVLGRGAFPLFAAGFGVLMASRFVTLWVAAGEDAGSLGAPAVLRWGLIGLSAPPVLWLFVSIGRHFGLAHAMGADHFFEAHRVRPTCNEGIHRVLPNAMYVVGFLPLWDVALGFDSLQGLVAAGYHHACIWLHYHGTERPDLVRMHGARSE